MLGFKLNHVSKRGPCGYNCDNYPGSYPCPIVKWVAVNGLKGMIIQQWVPGPHHKRLFSDYMEIHPAVFWIAFIMKPTNCCIHMASITSFRPGQNSTIFISWWRYQMETFSALLALCAGNSPVTSEFPSQRPVTRSFDVLFDLRLE